MRNSRDSVVTNVVKFVEILPKLNVTGDPELERLAAEVRTSLVVDPQELRKSESVRADTARAAAAIADHVAGYMAGYSVTIAPATATTRLEKPSSENEPVLKRKKLTRIASAQHTL
jgi:hypothetical protein